MARFGRCMANVALHRLMSVFTDNISVHRAPTSIALFPHQGGSAEKQPGLSVLHGLLKGHDGHVIFTLPIGKVTTFKIFLPVVLLDEFFSRPGGRPPAPDHRLDLLTSERDTGRRQPAAIVF
jgi:hypothetical protein